MKFYFIAVFIFNFSEVSEQSKLMKLTHGDSLDDVEGFPEDHVADYIHKLPHIEEIRYVFS